VKSRLQCPSEDCGRVSTTFDPFMYLSVPIPGATDRSMKVTFVPIEGPKREMNITLPKSGTILTMEKKVAEEWMKLVGDGHAIDVENLVELSMSGI
jgi:ubiquitin carboxyl-terminal hydrolase 4/11/15